MLEIYQNTIFIAPKYIGVDRESAINFVYI